VGPDLRPDAPAPDAGGPHRQVANGLLWKLVTGAQWRDVPNHYGPWQAGYEQFRRWRDDDLLDRMLARLQVRPDAGGRIDPELWCGDSTHMRASRSAAGCGKRGPHELADHALGLGRGGIATKLHLVTDSNGVPLAAMLSPGQRHEVPVFPALMDSVRVCLASGKKAQA
jgi:transposase